MPRRILPVNPLDIMYDADYYQHPHPVRRPHVDLDFADETALVTTTRPRSRVRPSSSDASPPDFLFCVELSMLLRSRHIRHQLPRTLKEELSSRLRQAGISARAHDCGERTENHKSWTVAEDASIPSQHADSRFAIKLVSPFFRFGPGHAQSWVPLLDVVMSVLNYDFETTTHHACSTSIHLVPARGHWKLGEAQSLASTALYFERCFDALMPYYRRRSVLAKSNRYNRYFARRTITQCVDAIHAHTGSLAALAARMNWCGSDTATGEALGAAKDFCHDTFRWNFGGLDAAGHGTIEFRQPPGVTDAADAVKWIMLAGCFARLSCAYFVVPEERPSMAHLGQWIRYEARRCGFAKTHVDEIRRLFDRADPVQFTAASARDADVISRDDAVRLRWLDTTSWNAGQEKFHDWLKHHPKKRRI